MHFTQKLVCNVFLMQWDIWRANIYWRLKILQMKLKKLSNNLFNKQPKIASSCPNFLDEQLLFSLLALLRILLYAQV